MPDMSLLDAAPLGERETTINIVHNDKPDLIAKLEATLEGLKDDDPRVGPQHPLWLRIWYNCCGGSPP